MLLPIVDLRRCQASGDCVRTCPEDCLQLLGTQPVLALPAACTSCGLCEAVCPVGAILLPPVPGQATFVLEE
jgi:NAD-dependent dihydropyrimidine dehydrogenase PreA subunit